VSSVVQFAYDALGRRIAKQINGIETHYLLDGVNVRQEYDGSGNLIAANTHAGLDNLLVRDDYTSGGSCYVQSDGLGSTVALSDGSGNIIERYRYSAFGKLEVLNPDFTSKSGNTPLLPCTYTGREWEPEMGMYFYRARYYDPVMGRFTSKDMIGLAGRDINLYSYCRNNPLNYIDSTGLAYFALRPLGRWPWIPIGSHNPIYDCLNTELSHEQIFFEDKLGGNIGFTKDESYGIWGTFGIGPAVPHHETDPAQIAKYRITRKGYNDEILRQAVLNIGLPEYNYQLLWFGFGSKFNCQDWAERVRKEYDRLVKKQSMK